MFAWFGIDSASLFQSRMDIVDFLPTFKGQKLSDLVGTTQTINTTVKKAYKKKGNAIATVTGDIDLLQLGDNSFNEVPMDVTVETVSFKEAVEAYIVRFSAPKNDVEEIDPKDPPYVTEFRFDDIYNAYTRSYEEGAARALRNDGSRSAVSLSYDNSNQFGVFHLRKV